MKKHTIIFVISILCLMFFACDGMATLFHGEKPEAEPSPVSPPVTYTVAFNANGGSSIPTQTVILGDMANRPENPTRDGYLFENWYSDPAFEYRYNFSIRIAGSITLYAKWNLAHTVMFNGNGGEPVPPSQTVIAGTTIRQPPDPLKDSHYLFAWYSDPGWINKYDFSTQVANSFTLYAFWNPLPDGAYVVTFDSNGGDYISSQNMPSGGMVSEPTDPSRKHYTFDGWYSDSGFNNKYDFSTPVTNNIRLYAKWNRITYTVSFNSNGGSSVSSQTVGSGGWATRPQAPTRSGYTFDNWYTDPGLTILYDFYTEVTGNVTLYANWDESNYTVSFNSNGGSAVPSQTVASGSQATRPTAPTRNGYIFDNWYTNPGLTNLYDFNSLISFNMTLYAKWNIGLTVSFNSNGGSGTPPAAQTVQAGSAITLPGESGLSRSGYVFGGWNTNAAGTGTNYAADSLYTPTSSVTLYAKWTNSGPTYTVTYNSNGGTGTVFAQVVQAGSSIMLSNGSGFSRKGYIFGGWNTNSTGNGTDYNVGASYIPTADITLYAKWLSFDLGDVGPGGGRVFYYNANGFTMTGYSGTYYYLEYVSLGSSPFAYRFIENYPKTSTAIGTGRNNTAIILGIDEGATAAIVCRNYTGGGKNDWFLPSLEELYQLYNNRSYVGLSGGAYWSSTCGSNTAARLDFSSGGFSSSTITNSGAVLAVRAF